MSADSAPSPLDLVALAQTINRNAVAALAFSTWDFCITVDREVAFIWSRPWRDVHKTLFFVMRYFAIVAQIAELVQGISSTNGHVYTNGQCRSWWMFQTLAIPFLTTCVQTVLSLRVCALYRQRRDVRILIAVFWCLAVITTYTGIAVYANKIPLGPDCHLAGPSAQKVPQTQEMFILIIVCQLILHCILVYLTMRQFAIAVKEGWGHTPILTLVVRDGIWAFLLTFILSVVNLMNSLVVTSLLGITTYCWTIAAYSMAGTRMLLNTFDRDYAGEDEVERDTVLSTHVQPMNVECEGVEELGNQEHLELRTVTPHR